MPFPYHLMQAPVPMMPSSAVPSAYYFDPYSTQQQQHEQPSSYYKLNRKQLSKYADVDPTLPTGPKDMFVPDWAADGAEERAEAKELAMMERFHDAQESFDNDDDLDAGDFLASTLEIKLLTDGRDHAVAAGQRTPEPRAHMHRRLLPDAGLSRAPYSISSEYFGANESGASSRKSSRKLMPAQQPKTDNEADGEQRERAFRQRIQRQRKLMVLE